MKKIISLILIGLVVLTLPCATAINLRNTDIIKSRPVLNRISVQPVDINGTGNFSGMYAKKNDTGYVILGSIEGTYEFSSEYTGSFSGIWNTTSGNASGTLSGWFWGFVFLGSIQYNNETDWFVGLYRINETSYEFGAVALILTSSFPVRYIAGTFD